MVDVVIVYCIIKFNYFLLQNLASTKKYFLSLSFNIFKSPLKLLRMSITILKSPLKYKGITFFHHSMVEIK